MPVSLAETQTFVTPVSGPAAADARNSASVRTPLQSLVSRTAWLKGALEGARLRNWNLRAHDTTGTPTGGVAVATKPWNGARDHLLAVLACGAQDRVQVSADGIHWYDSTTGIGGGTRLRAAAFFPLAGLGKWVVVGEGSAIFERTASGAISSSWTARGPGSGADLNAVACSSTLAVAVGDTGRIITSADGVTWTVRAAPSGADLVAVAHGVGGWVAVGDSGTIATSPDGITWTVVATSLVDFKRIAFEPVSGRFVAFHNGGAGGLPAAGSSSFTYAGVLTPTPTTLGWLPDGVCVDDAGSVVALRDTYVTWSTDAGATFAATGQLPRTSAPSIEWDAIAFSASMRCFIACGDVTGSMIAHTVSL